MNNILRSITFTLLVIQSIVTANAEAESIKQQAEQRQDFTIPSPPSLDGIKGTPESSAVPTPPLPPFAVNGNIKIGSMPPPPLPTAGNMAAGILPPPPFPASSNIKSGIMPSIKFGVNTNNASVMQSPPESSAIVISAMSRRDIELSVIDKYAEYMPKIGEMEEPYYTYMGDELHARVGLWDAIHQIKDLDNWKAKVEDIRKRSTWTKIKRKVSGVEQEELIVSLEAVNDISRLETATYVADPKLTKVNLHDNIEYIGHNCFAFTSLKEITLPKNLQVLGKSAFDYCKALTSVKFSNAIREIGQSAFRNCSALTKVLFADSEVTLDNLKTIPRYCFARCGKLTKIKIPNGVTNLQDYAFQKCYNLNEIHLPNTLEIISNGCFHKCEHLTSIRIPANVTTLGKSAFSGCSSLREILLPNEKLTSIMGECFTGCEELTKIVIPKNVSTLGRLAFSGCINLKTIEFLNTDIKIASDCFNNCNNLDSIIVNKTKYLIREESQNKTAAVIKALKRAAKLKKTGFF